MTRTHSAPHADSHILLQLLLELIMSSDALTLSEFDLLRTWTEANKGAWPSEIRDVQERLIALYLKMSKNKGTAADAVRAMRLAMGFIPKSERGAQLLEKH